MRRALATAALPFLLTLPAAQAAECDDPQDQATMNECAKMSYEASDAELNRLYRQIEQRLGDDADTKRLLIKAQRAWVSFRDAECGFSASAVEGGSAYPMTYNGCLDGLTQKRVTDFQQYLSCEEGDLACPVPPGD